MSLALAVAGIAGTASAQTVVAADVVANTTWCNAANPGPIVLQQPIFVKNGAVLTILPGCVVRGQPRTAPVTPGVIAGSPGALIVTQNGQIIANGSATSPIIFTTAAIDDNNDGVADGRGVACTTCATAWSAGHTFLDDTPSTAPLAPLDRNGQPNLSLWGGLVILGNAPTNLSTGCGVGKGKCTVEGLTIPGFPIADATYGGLLPHDNSGSLQYVSVRHGGDEIGEGNELNGISMAGVGDGTTVDHVEVYVNFDDGIEFFGGTVHINHFMVSFVGDDMFDLDQGYTGVDQFLFGIMPFFNANDGSAYGSGSGDKAGEWDGDDFVEAGGVNIDPDDGYCKPLSNPQMYNMTVMGSTIQAGNDFNPVSPAADNEGIENRNGYAGSLINSIAVNFGTRQAYDLDATVGAGCPNHDAIDNVGECLIKVIATTLDGAALPQPELDALACGDAGLPAASQNVSNNALFNGLTNEDTTFDPRGNAAGKLVPGLKTAPIDPRPAFGIIGTGGAVPGPVTVTYRGAFSRTAPTLWTTGWTALNEAGLLAD